jgi:NitT/TauT family transport system permease protein
MPRTLDRMLPALFLIAVVAVWELAVDALQIPRFILPPPSAIFARIFENFGHMTSHVLATTKEILVGFFLALIGGGFLAVIVSESRFLARTLYPLLVISQTIPTIAIAPILVIWFGPGDVARFVVVFLVAFFPIFVNVATGLIRVDDDLTDLVHGLGGSRWQMLIKIRSHNSIPYLFTGMRISITLAVIGAVVSEFVASTQGLGYIVFSGATNMDTPLMFSGVVLLAAMGFILFYVVRGVQYLAVPWARDQAEERL